MSIFKIFFSRAKFIGVSVTVEREQIGEIFRHIFVRQTDRPTDR